MNYVHVHSQIIRVCYDSCIVHCFFAVRMEGKPQDCICRSDKRILQHKDVITSCESACVVASPTYLSCSPFMPLIV